MSGSFESVRWNACVRRLDLCLNSQPKDWKGGGGGVGGGGVESETMLTPREKNLYRKLKGAWNPRRCITQGSEPNTPPTELCRPLEISVRTASSGVCVLSVGEAANVILTCISVGQHVHLSTFEKHFVHC